MIRFWRLYFLAVGLYVVGSLALALGPAVESRFAPVRIDQRIEAIERVGERLCWTWVSEKIRLVASDDIDVYLYDGLQDRMVGAIYRATDGMPWRAGGAMGLGRHALRYCTTLPPHVSPTQAVTVEMRAWYPGPAGLGLWRFPLVLPPVVSPGDGQ